MDDRGESRDAVRLLPAPADPMNPASWLKSGPVFVGSASVFGVGHASFTRSPDSTEDWIVYHSKTSATSGWDRTVRTQKFTWSASGAPLFGNAIREGVSLSRPAGECR